MSATFTPGPWVASQYMDTPEWGVINNANLIIVGLSSRITEGNANLIAAAPELYEALLKVVKYADSEPDGGVTVEMHRANVERARVALAKARGEA